MTKESHKLLCNMPVIILGSIGLFMILHGLSFAGGAVAILGFAISTFITSVQGGR